MRYCIDTLRYNGLFMRVTGWAVPEHLGDEVELTLMKKDGTPVNVEMTRIVREDVMQALFGHSTTVPYGFIFTYEADVYEDLRLIMNVPSSDIDHTKTMIRFGGAYESYLHEHKFLPTLKRFVKAKDKKSFRMNEKFAALTGEERNYAYWYERQRLSKEELKAQSEEHFSYEPKISVLVPVYRPDKAQFTAMVKSVIAQSYKNWELCLANGSADDEKIRKMVSRIARKDSRIRVTHLEKNGGISENTNAALSMASGEWIALLDQDDLYEPNALYELVKAMNAEKSAEVIYTDEDKLNEFTDIHEQQYFKTDYNPALLHSCNYICHLFAVKKSVADKVGGFRKEFDGAQDHDFILRCVRESSGPIVHVPKILYTWRITKGSTSIGMSQKSYANDAGMRVLKKAFEEEGLEAEILPTVLPGRYIPKIKLTEKPLVSVLIPSKDHVDDLSRCLNSLLSATYQNIEVLILENHSTEEATFAYYDEITKKDSRVRVLTYTDPFNFAAINNFGEKEAKGEYLLLLNNDIEVISPDFLESMMGQMLIDRVGVVGAKLYYEDGSIQHCGVLVLTEGAAHHMYLNHSHDEVGYMGRVITNTCLSAVTAACMLVKRSVYREVGGMEEGFTIAYNDIDFCLKVRKAGYYVVYNASAELTHYESKSRGYEDTEEKQERLKKEAELLYSRWPECVDHDPYYSPNLSMKHGYYHLAESMGIS